MRKTTSGLRYTTRAFVLSAAAVLATGCLQEEERDCSDAACSDAAPLADASVEGSDAVEAGPDWTPCCSPPEVPPVCYQGVYDEAQERQVRHIGGRRWSTREVDEVGGVLLEPHELNNPRGPSRYRFDTSGCRVVGRGYSEWRLDTPAIEHGCPTWVEIHGPQRCGEFSPP